MKLSDDDLIKEILKTNSSEALLELVDRHQKLFYSIIKKYSIGCQKFIEEVSDYKLQIFFDSIKSFDSNKGSKFTTWLANQTRFFCLNLKNKKNSLVLVENDFLTTLIQDNHSRQKTNKDNLIELTDKIKEVLENIEDENIKSVIKYRYFNGTGKVLNYQQIANKMSITAQTALNWHNKFVRLAKKKLTKI
jgi:RNA polymerase sigma factor (sigma-70 family)